MAEVKDYGEAPVTQATDNMPDMAVAGKLHYVEAPPRYYRVDEALLGFINRLEMECHHNRWLAHTTAEFATRPTMDQMEAVRNRNTSLEASNIRLRKWAEELKNATDAQDARLMDLSAILAGANEKVGNLMEINKGLEERIDNQASSINDLMKQKATSLKVEHIFRTPDHDIGFTEFVQETDRWQIDTFAGAATDQDTAMVLVEEVIEVAQLYGIKADAIVAKTVSVMNKPPGSMIQEFGGVAITLAGLIAKSPLEPRAVLVAALNDCWARQEEIRVKKGIRRAVGVGKMVPGALERLRAQGINVEFTEGMKLDPRASVGQAIPTAAKPEPVIQSPGLTGSGFAASAVVNERKEFGDQFAAAEAEAQQNLAKHIADTAAPHGKA